MKNGLLVMYFHVHVLHSWPQVFPNTKQISRELLNLQNFQLHSFLMLGMKFLCGKVGCLRKLLRINEDLPRDGGMRREN